MPVHHSTCLSSGTRRGLDGVPYSCIRITGKYELSIDEGTTEQQALTIAQDINEQFLRDVRCIFHPEAAHDMPDRVEFVQPGYHYRHQLACANAKLWFEGLTDTHVAASCPEAGASMDCTEAPDDVQSEQERLARLSVTDEGTSLPQAPTAARCPR